MASFRSTLIPPDNCVQVVLAPNFSDQHWAEFEEFFEEHIAKGFIFWDLDLRQMTYMNSLLMGLLVGLNAQLRTHRGNLRLVVREKSAVDQVLTISKLRRIMAVSTL